MKILIVWVHQVLGRAGGVQRIMINLANAMQERGHEVVIVHCSPENGPFFFSPNKKVKMVNLMDFSPLLYLEMPIILKVLRECIRIFDRRKALEINEHFKIYCLKDAVNQLLRQECPDVVVGEEIGTVTIFREIIQGDKIPFISMNHGNANSIWRSMTKLDRLTMQHCAAVQFLMPNDCKFFSKILMNTKVVCIPNAVPAYDFELNADNTVIINVARLDKRGKRQHLLIEAFARIAYMFPQWQLELWGEEIGQNKYTEELKNLISKYQLTERIHLRGKTNDVLSTYRHASIFAFPSAYEGFGLAMAEAMSAGLPVVAYRSCSAVNELVKDGETGFLVNDGVDALAGGLKKLMEHKALRERMGEAAHKSMQLFAPEKIWDQWETLMKDVIKK